MSASGWRFSSEKDDDWMQGGCGLWVACSPWLLPLTELEPLVLNGCTAGLNHQTQKVHKVIPTSIKSQLHQLCDFQSYWSCKSVEMPQLYRGELPILMIWKSPHLGRWHLSPYGPDALEWGINKNKWWTKKNITKQWNDSSTATYIISLRKTIPYQLLSLPGLEGGSVNARSLVILLLPFAVFPSLSIVLQDVSTVNSWSSGFSHQHEKM